MPVKASMTVLIVAMLSLSGGVASAAAPKVNDVIPVGNAPHRIDVDQDSNRIYVGNEWGATVIDGSTHDVVTSYDLDVLDLAINPVTEKLYVTTSNVLGYTGISVVDTNTDVVVKNLTEFGTTVAVNSQTNKIYVANNGVVRVIDGSTDTVVKTISGFTDAVEIAVDEKLNKVYVGDQKQTNEGHIVIVDGSTDAIVKNIKTNSHILGDIAVNPSNSKVYVTTWGAGDRRIFVLDGATNTPLGIMGTRAHPVGLSVSNNWIFVANFDAKVITVYNSTSDSFVGNINLSAYELSPQYVAANGSTKEVYVTADDYNGSDGIGTAFVIK
jgi:DNA-binding beta-propeller fold protein YncE